MVVGRLLSSWESLFSGALLVFWGVHIYMSIYIYMYIYISILQYTYICLCVCLCFLISPPPSAIFNHSPHRTILDSPMRVTMEAWRWGAKFHGSYMAMSIWFTAPSWERERFFFGDGMGAYLYIYIYKYIFVYSFIYLYIIIYLFIAWFIYLSIYCLNIRLYIYTYTPQKKMKVSFSANSPECLIILTPWENFCKLQTRIMFSEFGQVWPFTNMEKPPARCVEWIGQKLSSLTALVFSFNSKM